MNIIVITGAPGAGKSALLDSLAETLPGKRAYLDGDDVAIVRPFSRDVARRTLIQDNICACAKNFADWGADEAVLIERHKKKGWEGCDHPDELARLGGLDACIRQLQGPHFIDTTYMTVQDVVREAMNHLGVQQSGGGDAEDRAPHP